MISLRLDPQGVNIFSGSHRNTTTASVNQSSIDILEAGHKMHELSSRVKELESELEKYQVSTAFNKKNFFETIKSKIKVHSPLTDTKTTFFKLEFTLPFNTNLFHK
jgi:hypothetical protein